MHRREGIKMSIEVGDLRAYNVEELSKLLGVHVRTIMVMLKDGKMKGRKLAKRWYVTDDNLRDYFSQPEEGTKT